MAPLQAVLAPQNGYIEASRLVDDLMQKAGA